MNEGDEMLNDPIFADLVAPSEEKPKTSKSNKSNNSSSKDDLLYLAPGIDFGSDTNGGASSLGTDRRNNQIIGSLTKKPASYWNGYVDNLVKNITNLDDALELISQEYQKTLNSLKYKSDPYSARDVINLMYLLLSNHPYPHLDYDIVALGYNINDTAYMTKEGKVLVTFSQKMKVKYREGPNGRRKDLSMKFRPIIKLVEKVTRLTRNKE